MRRPWSRAAAVTVLAAALGVTACTNGGPVTQETPSDTGAPTSPSPSPTPTPTVTPSATPSATETDATALPEIPPAVRGVYSHVYTFWGDKWAHLIDLVETTELNSIVVDVKDEAGTLLWPIDHPIAEAAGGADWKPEGDPAERLQMLKDAGGWAIARIACFKDTLVAEARPDLAVQDASGGRWHARKDFGWLNPYQQEAGQWCIDVALAALEIGFDEIQFDYIRFPNGGDGDISAIELPGVPAERPRDQWRHPDQITRFLADASEQIHEAGGYVSADLFGLVTYDFSWDAGGTGQILEEIAEHVDFISPMVYPSHYSAGNYGLLPHPIEHPYETVWNAMQEAQMRVQDLHAEIRPWLEDFPAPWMGYDHDPSRLEAQIRATYENGIEGWLLWNAANTYSESVFAPGDTELKANADFVPPARTANPDAPPGVDDERQWPGMPPCDPFPGILQIGERNLAGSIPPELGLGVDHPDLCPEEEASEEATGPPTDAVSPTATPPDSDASPE